MKKNPHKIYLGLFLTAGLFFQIFFAQTIIYPDNCSDLEVPATMVPLSGQYFP